MSVTSTTPYGELSHPRPSALARGTAGTRSLAVVPDLDTPAMGSISPELALVDPELRAAALAALPTPSDCLAERPTPVARRPEPLRIVTAPAPDPVPAPAPAPPESIATARAPDERVALLPRAAAPSPAAHEGRRTAATIRVLALLLAVFLCAYFLVPPLLDLL